MVCLRAMTFGQLLFAPMSVQLDDDSGFYPAFRFFFTSGPG